MDFFGFVPSSLIGGIHYTTCGKKGHHFDVCLKRYTCCTHCEHYGHNSRNCPMKKFTPSELGNWLFKRQVEDDTLSQAISHCSLDGSPTDLELRKLLNQLDKYQDQVDDITSIGTHSISLFSSQ
jgi:transcription elongation factor Elf1